ncbi:MAG: hypothetical protein ACT4PE_07585 [Candidatus Eiseniibacteriota bacterium]
MGRGVNLIDSSVFRVVASTVFSSIVWGSGGAQAAGGTDVSVGVRRLGSSELREIRVRSRAAGTEWLLDVRRRGSDRDEARLGVSIPWGGGMLRAGNLRETVPTPSRRPADPLDPPRASPGPALTAARGADGIAWTREGIDRAVSFALSEGREGETVPAARVRWRRIDAALAGGARRVGALGWSLAARDVRARAECWLEDGTREANLSLVADGAGLAVTVRREPQVPWSADVLGGVAVRAGVLRGLSLRVRAGHRLDRSRDTWKAAWHPLGGRLSGDVGEVRGRLRWNVRGGRSAPAGWIVECGVGGGAHRPAEVTAELRRVRRDRRGGARLVVAEDRARRGSAWLTQDLGTRTRLRMAAVWERERRSTVEIELTRVLHGSP